MKLGKKVTKNVSNLVYYDSTTKVSYNSVGSGVAQYVRKLDNKTRVVSAIPFDTLLKATIEVPKTLDENEIEDFIGDNAYKQLKLAHDARYEMAYFRAHSGFDADNWMYDAYLVDAKQLEKTYDEVSNKTQFIDVVTSVPFLPVVLYKTNRLDTISNHIFVFIEENSSTFAFYSKGEPVYIKSMVSSIHKLRVEFNQESALELNSVEFENFIAGKSPDTANYRTNIESMLNKITHDIEECIGFIKRVYPELDPTAVYFGMSIEYDNEFLSFFRDSFLLETKSFSQLTTGPAKKDLLAVANLAMSYASYAISTADSSIPNFSHLKRPKPLNQRESGQFVIVAVGLFVLSLVYPIYNFAMTGFYTVRNTMLQTTYDSEVFPKAEQYRSDEESLKRNAEVLQKQKQQVDEQILALRGDLNDIHTWQMSYIQKSKILNDILQVANNSKVRVIKATSISNNNQHLVVELNLFAKDQKDITDFVRTLSQKGVYKSVFTDKVEKISLSDKDREELTSRAQTLAKSVATKVSDAAAKAADKVADAAAAVVANEPESISAKINLSENNEISRSVSGYLNSIVKVVVR